MKWLQFVIVLVAAVVVVVAVSVVVIGVLQPPALVLVNQLHEVRRLLGSLDEPVPQQLLCRRPLNSINQHHMPIQSYECIALCKDTRLQGGRFCARSVASCIL